jgi:hypothetical protein
MGGKKEHCRATEWTAEPSRQTVQVRPTAPSQSGQIVPADHRGVVVEDDAAVHKGAERADRGRQPPDRSGPDLADDDCDYGKREKTPVRTIEGDEDGQRRHRESDRQ